MEFTIRKSRTGTVPCSGTPLKGANLVACSTFFPLVLGTSSHGTEHRIDYTCVSHKFHEAVAITCTLKDQFSSMHAYCSQRDKSKRHLSKLIDVSMLRDDRCKTEFRKRLGKQKLMNYTTHFEVLPSEPSASSCCTLDFEAHVGNCSVGRFYPETFQNGSHERCFLQVVVIVIHPFLTW